MSDRPVPETRPLCGACKDREGVVCDLCGNGIVPLEQRRVPFRRVVGEREERLDENGLKAVFAAIAREFPAAHRLRFEDQRQLAEIVVSAYLAASSPSPPDREQAVEKVALLIFADVQAAVTEPTAKRLAEAIVAALFGSVRGDES